jgi:hypothetical protein
MMHIILTLKFWLKLKENFLGKGVTNMTIEVENKILDLYFDKMFSYSEIMIYFKNKYSYPQIKSVINKKYEKVKSKN